MSSQPPNYLIIKGVPPQTLANILPPTPPPAYTTQQTIQPPITTSIHEAPPTSTLFADDVTPSIHLHISTPLLINGSKNDILFSPAAHAAAIADAAVKALKEVSMSRAGIPMIDEEGRLRGVEVVIEAGVEVKGSGNRLRTGE